jgi:hypothetical protein
VIALAVGAAPAGAATTLGQLAQSPVGVQVNQDLLPYNVSAGASYAAPGPGTITSWQINAATNMGQIATLKVYRNVSGTIYQVIGLDGPHNLNAGLVNNFVVNIPVQAGDVIGCTGTGATGATCLFSATPADSYLVRNPGPTLLALGDQASFFGPNTGARLNVQATFEPTPPGPPSNNFTIAGTTLNKKNGTATLNFNLPAPGDLSATGPGVSAASAGWATISKAVGAGPATLVISAAGKQKKKLRQKGKVTLNVAVTYTPTGGSPKTQSVSVNLKLKKKKK